MVKNSLWQRASLVLLVFGLFALFTPLRAEAVLDITALSSSTHSPGTVKNIANITFSWTIPSGACTGAPAAVAGYSYVISTSITATVDTSLESADCSFSTVQVTASPDSSTWYFRIRAIGSGGTPGTILTSSAYNIDTTSPSSVSNASTTPGNGQVTIAWTTPSTDYKGTMIRYRTDGTNPTSSTNGTLLTDDSTTASGTATTTNHSGATNDQAYHYSLFAYDQAGNFSSAAQINGTPNSSGYTGSISIVGGASYTNNTTVALTLLGSSSSGTVNGMQFSTDDITYDNGVGGSSGTVASYATSFSYGLSSTEGTQNVYVKYVTGCGSITSATQINECSGTPSSSFNDSITLDTTKPVLGSPSISITGGLTTTISQSIPLTLSAIDSGSGMAGMEIDQLSTFGNNNGYTAYNISATYTLFPAISGTTYEIYVRFKDAAGNISSTESATITYTGVTVKPIPTLSEWGMIIFISLLLGSALFRFYRKQR